MKILIFLFLVSRGMLLIADSESKCFRSYSYRSVSRSTYKTGITLSGQIFELSGKLLMRRLKESSRFISFGFQWYKPNLVVNRKRIEDDIYGIPFAATLDRKNMKIVQFKFPDALDITGRNKLSALFYTLHVHPPGDLFGRLFNRFQVKDSDQAGYYLSRYYSAGLNHMIKEKIHYFGLLKQQSLPVGRIGQVNIHHNRLKYQQDECWLVSFDYHSAMTLVTSMNIRVHTNSDIQGMYTQDTIPEDALLAKLPMDPKHWPDLSRLLPSESISTAKGKEFFLPTVKKLLAENSKLADLIRIIKHNRNFVNELENALEKFSDPFISKLMLALGKVDIPETHRLLVTFTLDPEISQANRFRALMALRYSKNLYDQVLIDKLIQFGGNQLMPKPERNHADSTLLVLGSVAGNMKEGKVSEHIIAKIKNLRITGIRKNLILDAIGNSLLREHLTFVLSYFDSEDPVVRKSAVDNYQKIADRTDPELIWSYLKKEDNSMVKAALIQSLQKSNYLPSDLVGKISNWINIDFKVDIRLASINLIASKPGIFPNFREIFGTMLVNEQSPRIVDALMAGIYSVKE